MIENGKTMQQGRVCTEVDFTSSGSDCADFVFSDLESGSVLLPRLGNTNSLTNGCYVLCIDCRFVCNMHAPAAVFSENCTPSSRQKAAWNLTKLLISRMNMMEAFYRVVQRWMK